MPCLRTIPHSGRVAKDVRLAPFVEVVMENRIPSCDASALRAERDAASKTGRQPFPLELPQPPLPPTRHHVEDRSLAATVDWFTLNSWPKNPAALEAP
jgi:hypothetical protein